MHITKCLHAAVLVSDLEKAEHFYSKILGLTKVERPLKYSGVWYQVEDFQFHLIVAPNASAQLKNPQKWGRNPHIAFSVADLEVIKNLLLEHGCDFQMSASGREALFTQDPDGNIIELSQL